MTDSNPFNISPTKLVRTQTPVPDTFITHLAFREATLKGTTAANTRLNKDLSLSSPLCRDINVNGDNDDSDDGESEYNSDGDDGDDERMKSQENINNNNNDNNNDDDQEGRKRSFSVLDLDSVPGEPESTMPITRSGSPRALAIQANKKSKRIRVDPSSTIKKTVRFDESRNKEFIYEPENSGSSILARTITSASATRPVISAFGRRQPSSTSSPFSFSPFTFNSRNNNSIDNINNNNINANPENTSSNQFSLSLENTSQDVMDFASSLSRLMGGSNESKSTLLSPPFSQVSLANNAGSPMRSFSPSFQNSPSSSSVRSTPMSTFSPPVSSSLSSFWSPSTGEDEDEIMESSSQSSQSSHPVSRTSTKFTPRRPRVSSPLRTQPTGPKPRFPSMLKREPSNASFMDNYPSSLAIDEPSTPDEPVVNPMETDLQSGSLNHAAIAAAILNMPSLTKSASDVCSTSTSSMFDVAPQHKRSSSWDLGQTSTSSSKQSPSQSANTPSFGSRFNFDAKKA